LQRREHQRLSLDALLILSLFYSTFFLSDSNLGYIMNRRILVVLLPSLEKSPAELASLGKISLSAIRNACSVGLGAQIEGDAADVLESLPTDAVRIGLYLCIRDLPNIPRCRRKSPLRASRPDNACRRVRRAAAGRIYPLSCPPGCGPRLPPDPARRNLAPEQRRREPNPGCRDAVS
jgi:hypothetical protein